MPLHWELSHRKLPTLWKSLLLMIVCLQAVDSLAAAEAERPNVVIIFCDDQGYQDLGCFGSPDIKTPNVDRLAEEGMRFTDFYSAYCVCSASRASLLTGSYQPRINMKSVLGPHTKTGLHPDEVTIADMLKEQGYATACVGKWHVGDTPETLPMAQGFDSYFGLPYSNDMARQKGWGNDTKSLDKIWRQKRWDIYNNELYRNFDVIESPVNQTTLTDRYTEEAVGFIREQQDGPFFLYLAHTMPHVPLFVSDERYGKDPHTAYRRTIEHIDASVGALMKALEETGQTENTLIAYTSDNGPWLSKDHHGGSALPLRAGKATTYEGGMRVPCVMCWPRGIAAGQTCQQVAGTVDLLPTLAAVCGGNLPEDRPIDGVNIASLWEDPDGTSPREKIGYHYYRNDKMEAIRLGDWKLHFKKSPELYHLRNDIGEENNLAEAHPDLVERLTKAAENYDAELQRNSRPAWNAP